MNRFIPFLSLGAVLACVLSVQCASAADKYYLINTEGTDAAAGAFTDASRWALNSPSGTPASAFDSTADYIFKSAQLRVRVVGSTDKTFAGGRLIVGEGGNHASLYLSTAYSPAVTTFGNDGLIEAAINGVDFSAEI